jgi:hypothetical protein
MVILRWSLEMSKIPILTIQKMAKSLHSEDSEKTLLSEKKDFWRFF